MLYFTAKMQRISQNSLGFLFFLSNDSSAKILSLSEYLNIKMKLFLLYLISINGISFLLFGIDKLLAIKNKRRIPEKELFTIATIGGAFGGLFAMLVFNHKISKTFFMWRFMFIFIVNVVGVYFLFR